jgi:hypothetical protein
MLQFQDVITGGTILACVVDILEYSYGLVSALSVFVIVWDISGIWSVFGAENHDWKVQKERGFWSKSSTGSVPSRFFVLPLTP